MMSKNEQPRIRVWFNRAIAIIEIAAVLVVGSIAARYALRRLALTNYKAELAGGPSAETPDFLWLSGVTAAEMSIRFGAIIALAVTVGWFLRRWTPRTYGITTSGRSIVSLVVIGWVVFALSFPVKLMVMAGRHFSPGAGAAHWWIFDLPWSPSFWLFMATSSVILPPLFEEFIFRGYCQTRLMVAFGPRTAILIIALVFAAAHGQYHNLDALSIGMLLGIFYGSVCLGYAFYRTGSLLPCIVAHALGNVPVSGVWEIAALVLMIVTVVIAWRPIVAYASDFFVHSGETPDSGRDPAIVNR